METDELIRRQMARELSNAVSDVRDAKLAAFRQENREVADSLNEIEDRLDLVRTEVEAAPAASSIVSQDGFPKQRIERMVRFEEEMMRSARNLTIRSQTVKSNLASEDIAELSMGLDNFQRTFSKRLGLLEGFRDL
jgi:predicted translin family RNA/ssDNA-binding protein